MSVINKMLRDLDNRQAGASVSLGAVSPGSRGGPTATWQGMAVGRAVAAVAATQPASAGRASRPALRIGVVALLVLATLAVAAWWLPPTPVRLAGEAPLPALATLALPTASVVPVAKSVTTPNAKSSAMTPTVVHAGSPPHLSAASGAAPTRLVDRQVFVGATPSALQSASQVANVVVSAESSTLSSSGQRSLMLLSDTPPVPNRDVNAPDPARAALMVQPQPSALAPTGAATSQASHQPDALLSLVAQAQASWRDGDRSSALKLLQDAVQRLESHSVSSGQGNAAMVALVREYARCSLISGQAAEVLATLDRLQPQLVGIADVWAIRGNAAQRLGQHTQAVAAYQQALALNPNEARWMLGAAVSLAALGQTGPAAELAEKVHSAHALPADVANYLRQLGVAIRPD